MTSPIIPIEGFGLTATQIETRIIADDLAQSCTLYWQVTTADGVQCKQGNASISGEDYANWTGDNDTAIAFCAAEAGVELAPDEEPVVEGGDEIPTGN
jgi:hypothetical protein